MDLLAQLKRLSGADAALGLRFARGNEYAPLLPDGARLLGYTDSVYFCFIEGYQNTVFAVMDKMGFGTYVYPLSYDFRDFLRLIRSCGSAEMVAKAGIRSREQFRKELPEQCSKALERLCDRFDIAPVEDPYAYVQTVGQVIDCSPIRL